MPFTSKSSLPTRDFVRDIFLWRRKKLSLMVLFVATATWVLLDVYQFNFITVASWVAMSIVASLFLYGNILRLLGKKPPNLSGFEITEKSTLEIANSCREMMEEAVRWMFRVSAERECSVFVKTVAGLLLLSYVGSFTDLLTLLYIGIVMGMTVPVCYIKCQDKIKRCGEWVKLKSRKLYCMVDEKVIKKMKKKVVKETKQKKIQ